ncbi:MAG: hypothetical protein OEX04_13640 [Acidimicrobiia bacterium]|nr:hypothetical protein [Acidimicrobiia bacterium]MDH4308512.1 hypothetical protein [Acidimicrobiia bacterium]
MPRRKTTVERTTTVIAFTAHSVQTHRLRRWRVEDCHAGLTPSARTFVT